MLVDQTKQQRSKLIILYCVRSLKSPATSTVVCAKLCSYLILKQTSHGEKFQEITGLNHEPIITNI